MGLRDSPEEWFKQADYDMATARFLFKGGRRTYAVFMLHLSVEKALKGLYFVKLARVPPKTHSLLQLLEMIGSTCPRPIQDMITMLSEASVASRYPEDLVKVRRFHTPSAVRKLLDEGKEVLAWIRAQR